MRFVRPKPTAGIVVNTTITRNLGAYGGYDLLTTDRAISHSGTGGVQLVW